MLESRRPYLLAMKRFQVLFLLLLLFVLDSRAQKLENYGLVTTGSVRKTEAKCLDGKPIIAVSLSLQNRNDSSKPILLISGWSISTVKFNFITTKPGASAETFVAADVLEYNPYWENPFRPETKDDYDPDASWATARESRTAPEPIPPGGYKEWQGELWLKSGFGLSPKATQAWKACRSVDEVPVPDYPAFYLDFRTSLKRYAGGDDAMRVFQERWKSIGHLPLDSSGDIFYRSETIIFPAGK